MSVQHQEKGSSVLLRYQSGIPKSSFTLRGGGSDKPDFDKKVTTSTMEQTISKFDGVVRMEIRPTGLLILNCRKTPGIVQDLMSEINKKSRMNVFCYCYDD